MPPADPNDDERDDTADTAEAEQRRPSDEPGLLGALVLLFATPLPALRYSRSARRLALVVAFAVVLAVAWLSEFFGCADRRPGAGGGDPAGEPAEP